MQSKLTAWLIPVLALLLALGATLLAAAAEPAISELTILADGKAHPFRVELAVQPEEQARGLMFRRQLAADAGMLFDYGPAERDVAMWMKNTFIPLDMLFIKADGTVAGVVERTIPQSLTTIPSPGPVRAVLELNGGTAARLKIAPGARVRHRIFGN